MARAKNTSRAEARRRTKELTRAEMADQQADDADDTDSEAGETVATVKPPHKSMFTMPDIRSDLRGMPVMFRTRRLLWVPFIMVAVGFVLELAGPVLSTDLQNYVILYIEYFFLPQALFTYFIGGFLATRSSYLVGFLLGLMTGVLWVVLILLNAAGLGLDQAGVVVSDAASASVFVLVESIFLGTVAGWFAGWYRDFLRGMQDRNKQRAAEREAQARIKRRDDRQEARKSAKGRVG
ncbi:MAG TPA: YrzE family protein [Candidatus Limnocylindrales bacterium]